MRSFLSASNASISPPEDTESFQSCPVDGEASVGDSRLGNERPPPALSWGGKDADADGKAWRPAGVGGEQRAYMGSLF